MGRVRYQLLELVREKCGDKLNMMFATRRGDRGEGGGGGGEEGGGRGGEEVGGGEEGEREKKRHIYVKRKGYELN